MKFIYIKRIYVSMMVVKKIVPFHGTVQQNIFDNMLLQFRSMTIVKQRKNVFAVDNIIP